MDSRHCKYCNKIFYKKDFPKCFNRMITCGSQECKTKLKKDWTFSKLCPDCNTPIVYFAQKCKTCCSLGSNNPFYGKTHKPESLANINLFKSGHVPFMKGRHHKPEAKLKNSLAHQGENSPCWQGGKSFEQYTLNWNKILRRLIRERDNYICQLCGDLQDDYAFDVHHIDYNKKNCNKNNLITLCRGCHSKTNYNRNKWEKLFNEKIKSSDYNRTIV